MDKRVKLLVSFDIFEENSQSYYQFVIGEFLPKAQSIGLVLTDALHTAFGDYPDRLLCFVARDRPTLDAILKREEWQQIEDRLKGFVSEYQAKIVPYRDRFQF